MKPAKPDAESRVITEEMLSQIRFGGNILNGATVNGGDLIWSHLAHARQILPDRHKERLIGMEWWMSTIKSVEFIRGVWTAATRTGDRIITRGDDGRYRFYGRPVNIVDALGAIVLLAEPENLFGAMDVTAIVEIYGLN
jgi:hypothetical protein